MEIFLFFYFMSSKVWGYNLITMRARRASRYYRWRHRVRRGGSVGDHSKDGGRVGDPAAEREGSQNSTRNETQAKLGLSADVEQIGF